MPRKQYTFEAVQQRLREARSKVKLYLRGQEQKTIWVQGTFPPKPGSDRPKPYQQKFSLHLPANEEGFKAAEAEAFRISALLMDKTKPFPWNDFLDPKKIPETKPAKCWIAEFKNFYMETHTLSESTWKNHWMKVYKRLNLEAPITAELLEKLVLQTKRNSRNRSETCKKLQKLANFMELEIDLLQYKGNYGPSRVEDRDIRSDLEIAKWWYEIPNPAWKWIYGVIATYGLRPHEALFCQPTPQGLQVLKGKTGPRLVFEALYPEWVDEWNLMELRKPNIDAEGILQRNGSFDTLGNKVTRQLKRYGVPFPAYDLRHAYAIRCVMFGITEVPAAALMGHSPVIHLRTYQKHISLIRNREAVDRAMNHPKRPKPPVVELNVGEDVS